MSSPRGLGNGMVRAVFGRLSLAFSWITSGLLGAPLHVLAAEAGAAPGEPPPTYSLSWVRGDGAESCPAGRVLAAEVERRLGRKVFDAAAERSFEVEVVRVGERFKSDVYVRDASGRAVGHRSLQGDEPGCAALLGATALAIALVIDPEAAAREPVASATFEAPPAPMPPTPPAPPHPAPAPAPVAVTRVERVLVMPSRPLLTVAWRGHVTGALVPRVSPGVELSVNARLGERWGIGASAQYVRSQHAASGIGAFDIGLTRASLLGTYDAAAGESVRWLLAGGPSLGALHLAVREPAPVTAPGDYLLLALALESELQVSVSKEVFLDLGVAGALPLRRQEFLVRGQADPVWRQPRFAGSGFLGVGARFP